MLIWLLVLSADPRLARASACEFCSLGILSELATLEFIDDSLGDHQILDHAIVLFLVFSLHLVDYQLGVTEDLDVFCPHLMGEC